MERKTFARQKYEADDEYTYRWMQPWGWSTIRFPPYQLETYLGRVDKATTASSITYDLTGEMIASNVARLRVEYKNSKTK